MPKASWAVTVKELGLPAVVVVGRPAMRNLLAVAGVTVVLAIPVMLEVTVSVAFRDCAPAVLRVALKLPVPFVRAALLGRTACPSLLVNKTTPV